MAFVSAFAPRARGARAPRAGGRCAARTHRTPPRMRARSTIAGREYQLEELEDAGDSVTALQLRADGSVAHGRTDGPVPERAGGEWVYDEGERELVLQLERHFKDGDVEFSVRRVLRGHLDGEDREEDMAVFAGNIYQDAKDIGDTTAAIGHFSLVDASSDLPSNVSARNLSRES